MSKWAFGILLIFYYKLPTYFVYFTVALTEICRLVALDTRLAKFYAIIFGVQLLNILVTSVLKAKYYKDKTTRFMCTFFYVAIFCLTFGLSFLDPSHSNIVIMIIPWAYTFVAYEMRRIYLHKICNEVLSVFKRIVISITDKIVCFFIPVAILSYMIYKLHVLPTWTLIIMIILFVLSIPYIAFVEDMSGEDILSLGQYYKDDDEDDDIDFENDDDNKKDE